MSVSLLLLLLSCSSVFERENQINSIEIIHIQSAPPVSVNNSDQTFRQSSPETERTLFDNQILSHTHTHAHTHAMYIRPTSIFNDRQHAGELLAEKLRKTNLFSPSSRDSAIQQRQSSLSSISTGGQPLVLALPRGGLPVAAPICRTLRCPLDIIVCKKIGMPGHEEFAIGACSPRGKTFVNDRVTKRYPQIVTPQYIEQQARVIMRQSREREREYRGREEPLFAISGRDVILVDDGIATGMTMRAAINDVHEEGARSITLAVPVLPGHTLDELKQNQYVTDVVYIEAPMDFRAVGRFYDNFEQTTDYEAKQVLSHYGKQFTSLA